MAISVTLGPFLAKCLRLPAAFHKGYDSDGHCPYKWLGELIFIGLVPLRRLYRTQQSGADPTGISH